MSDAIDAKPFPRGVLIASAALVAFTVMSAATARLTGFGATHVDGGATVHERLLSFTSLQGGGYRVTDVSTGEKLADLSAHKHGFVGAVLTGPMHERMRSGISPMAPFRLIQTTNGRLELYDTATDRAVLLDAFGADNRLAFSQFLTPERESP